MIYVSHDVWFIDLFSLVAFSCFCREENIILLRWFSKEMVEVRSDQNTAGENETKVQEKNWNNRTVLGDSCHRMYNPTKESTLNMFGYLFLAQYISISYASWSSIVKLVEVLEQEQNKTERHVAKSMKKQIWKRYSQSLRRATTFKNAWHLVVFQQLWCTFCKIFVKDEHGNIVCITWCICVEELQWKICWTCCKRYFSKPL